MKLVIVESASKTKSIQKYLGPDYKVMASLGHIMNLPPKDLGVDTNSWELTYEAIPTNSKPVPKKPRKCIWQLTRTEKEKPLLTISLKPLNSPSPNAFFFTKLLRKQFWMPCSLLVLLMRI